MKERWHCQTNLNCDEFHLRLSHVRSTSIASICHWQNVRWKTLEIWTQLRHLQACCTSDPREEELTHRGNKSLTRRVRTSFFLDDQRSRGEPDCCGTRSRQQVIPLKHQFCRCQHEFFLTSHRSLERLVYRQNHVFQISRPRKCYPCWRDQNSRQNSSPLSNFRRHFRRSPRENYDRMVNMKSHFEKSQW